MAKKIDIPKDTNIIQMPIEEAMPDNYLPYAVEVARDRALPDVRDGLKPVHRRIVYGAYMLKAFPDKPYYKSARIVGDILGKYHPHGDSSVYDAMVILAQDFSTRMPIIDGHGNWGSIDGDNAAAMRYTEARLTPVAIEMIKDIEKNVVDMVDNYSGSEKEPQVLPTRYPNLLVNGAFGIAVGLATNIPPHNLREVIDSEIAYIDNQDITTRELMQHLKGPDLPTGGIIIGRNSLLQAYETGEGRVTLRAKTSIERLESGRLGIVITEFPYRRNKAKLLQMISEMTADKRHAKSLEAISDIRDESDRTGIRAVIELRKSADEEMAERVLKYLFKKTDLQCNISYNMVALANGKPETMGLKTILSHCLNHQKDVITRRTKRELETAEKRFEIINGFIKAIGIMDEVIATIRGSKSKKDAHGNLMEKFGFSGIQAEAILELMLYRLTGLEIKAFEKEYKELEREIKRLRKILESETELLKVIKNEMMEIREKFGDDRRTVIIENDEEAKIDLEELIIEEDVMITISNEGYVKRIPVKTYNRSNADINEIEYREGDFNRFLISSNTKDTVMIFTDRGNMYQLKGLAIPEMKWKEKGEKIDTMVRGLDLSKENMVAAFSISNMAAQKEFMLITSTGGIKKTALDKFNTAYTKIMALKMKNDETLVDVKFMDVGRQEEFIHFETEKGLSFTVEEPELECTDRNIICTQLINISPDDKIARAEFEAEFNYKEFYLYIDRSGTVKSSDDMRARSSGTKTSSRSMIMIFTKNGDVHKMPAVMLQNLSDGLDIEGIFHGVSKDSVVKIISVEEFKSEEFLYFFTKKGMIKKTSMEEFTGDYLMTKAYKLKHDDDEVIAVEKSSTEGHHMMMVTEKGMCIRFEEDSVKAMGRVASGVTGISLREDDQVVFGTIITSQETGTLKLKSKKNMEENVKMGDVKIQNRAGRGKSVLMIVMDDAVCKVSIE